jgi:hypothetical protein
MGCPQAVEFLRCGIAGLPMLPYSFGGGSQGKAERDRGFPGKSREEKRVIAVRPGPES